MNVTITAPVVPTFTQLGPYCQNAVAGILPTSSTNATPITGIWSPSTISTTTVGTQTYTFTPTTSGCVTTATMDILVNPIPNAGTNGTLVICSNAPAQDLFLSLLGTPQTGGVWSPALHSGTGFFDPAFDIAGVYTYTVTGLSPCGSTSATVTVSITQAPNAGISNTLTLCGNSTGQDLFLSLGGTPQTGGVWSPALHSGTGFFDPAFDTAGVYTYTVAGTAPCAAGTATATVTVNPIPNAGTNGTLVICSNAPAQDLFLSLLGTPQTGGVWSPALHSGTGFFDPAFDIAGVYTYTVTGLSPCGSTSATVTVSITQAPNAGISNTLTLCGNSTGQDLFLSLGGTPQTGGVWSPALHSGTGFFDPAFDTAGVYTYTVAGTAPCAANATISVTINALITPIFNASGPYCPNDTPGNLQTVSNNGITGIWFPATISTTTVGTQTYTFTPALGQCASSTFLEVTITSAIIPTFTILDSYCQNASPDVLPTQSTNGGITGTWSPSTISTTEIGTQIYTFTPLPNQCSTPIAINVIINNCPATEIIIPDGFSPNGDGINDEFVVKNLADLYPNFTLEIYNRYGSVLYKGNINTPNWNGKSIEGLIIGDGLLPTGVYFFIIEFNDGNRKALQGRVYLSR